jgi:FkbM family methyltransferase
MKKHILFALCFALINGKFYSQSGQDKYLIENIFQDKKNGIFVDVGAYDGITYSNTYYLEKEKGWSGICIEPNPNVFESLVRNRKLPCLSCGVCNFSGRTDFTLIKGYSEMLSGITKTYNLAHPKRIDWEIDNMGGNKESIQIEVKPLEHIFRENNISYIDYISIDTEGSEEQILKSINFNDVYIDVISVECNYGIDQIQEFLFKKGFTFLERIGDDKFFRNMSNKNPFVVSKINEFSTVAYSTIDTLNNSYDLALECIKNNIKGDFVECGVAMGSQVAAMALACKNMGVAKKIHLLDSFEGIPIASVNDVDQPGIGFIPEEQKTGELKSSGVTVCPLSHVKRKFREWQISDKNFIYHKGWFQQVLPKVHKSIKFISCLRLDGDLYDSTKVCLKFLYPKVVKGGYIIIDDYDLEGCRKAIDEYLSYHGIKVDIKRISGDSGPVYWIKK